MERQDTAQQCGPINFVKTMCNTLVSWECNNHTLQYVHYLLDCVS